MRYAIWNNKGGVGKSFLSFVIGTEIANRNKSNHVILVDMCPQANLSEIVLGGNGGGAQELEKILASSNRKTVGGYFDKRIASPHQMTGGESGYTIPAIKYNNHLPSNLSLICGDPSLEIQAQVMSQIGGQTLPADSWKNVRNWLLDLITACQKQLGVTNTTVLIDCNPSFSAYTELAMIAAERLIIPCSSDGSSARAITNIGTLLYGINNGPYHNVGFNAKVATFSMPLPKIQSVLLNRSTQYNKKASRAFKAMFDEIGRRAYELQTNKPEHFVAGDVKFLDVPDTHSVAIVCSHLGKPLYDVKTGRYEVHDKIAQVNKGPLSRYKDAIEKVIDKM